MADFVNTTTTKTAVRDLAAPIQTSVLSRPSSRLSWIPTPGDAPVTRQQARPFPVLAKTRESYYGRIVYESDEAKIIGQTSVKAPTISMGFRCNFAIYE
jgi:hypothetical protein